MDMSQPSSFPKDEQLYTAWIVRAFTRNCHIVHMAFTQSRAGDADELSLGVELVEVFRAHIPHGRADAAGQLMQHGRGRTFVWHLTFDAFRHQLERVLDVLLEVSISRTARHRADRAHAPIRFVGTSLIEKHLAR